VWLQSAIKKQPDLVAIFWLRLSCGFGQLPGRVRLAGRISVNGAKPLSICGVRRVRLNE
jgi:hypothetical protein